MCAALFDDFGTVDSAKVQGDVSAAFWIGYSDATLAQIFEDVRDIRRAKPALERIPRLAPPRSAGWTATQATKDREGVVRPSPFAHTAYSIMGRVAAAMRDAKIDQTEIDD